MAQKKKIHMCGNPDCQRFADKFKIPEGQKCFRCGWDMLTTVEFEIWNHYSVADEPDDHFDFYGHHGPSNHVPVTQERKKPNDTFSAPACLTGCPIAQQPEIRIPHALYEIWVDMARAIETEWLAYLQGSIVNGVYIIDAMTFPEQTASSVHVSAKDGELVPEGTIAAVHSHVNMEVFFSQEDQNHFNHPIELVVNRKGELLANGASILQCGQPHRGPAKIVFTGKVDATPFVAELKAKLTADARTLVATGNERREPLATIRHHSRGLQ